MSFPKPKATENRREFGERFAGSPQVRAKYKAPGDVAKALEKAWAASPRATTKAARLGARIVGPAAPKDQEITDPETHSHWMSMREAVTTLGKRMGGVRQEDHSEAVQVEKAETSKKVPGSDRPLSAPTGTRTDQDSDQFTSDFVDDALEPPYPFDVLCSLYENSAALRRNIDALMTNIDGFGHRFEPIIDFSHPSCGDRIRDLMILERVNEIEDIDLSEMTEERLSKLTPTIVEIEKRQAHWKMVAALEKARLSAIFEFLNPLESFTEVRQAMRESQELLGNAGWEIIREDSPKKEGEKDSGKPAKIVQVWNVPFTSVRLLRLEAKPVDTKMIIRKDAVTFETITVQRFFRRFVRITGRDRTYYKEFGDPRTVSRRTGKVYESVEAMRADADEGENAPAANEFFHWKIRSQLTPYGVPRWIGALLSVLGSRAAEEVNFMYFDNKAIPPMVLMVSGGTLSKDSVTRLETHIESHIKGRKNFHKILILEALPADADESSGDLEHSGKMRIELKPLMGDQSKDALFQEYDKANEQKIGRAFRQPQLLTGDARDMNRSTADVAKAFAEEQIYQPARDAFDAAMDRLFVPTYGARFWRFKTNAPVQRIPNDLVANVCKSLDAGAIVPNEARALLNDAFSIDLEHRPEEWAQVPPKLAQASARMGGGSETQVIGADMETLEDDLNTAFEEGAAAVVPGGGAEKPAGGSEKPAGTVKPVKPTKKVGKRTQVAHGAVAAIGFLRAMVEDEVEQAKRQMKDEFFDPSKWGAATDEGR